MTKRAVSRDDLLRARSMAVHLRTIPTLIARARSADKKPRGYRRCPQCGNPTRGTPKAGDDRCAKCQGGAADAT